ncbi:hypothetical protein IQE94_15030 [Synechocystis sp. PCC 7339]|uniref:hypothetical protein n=1 Tax=unclassified Synechocystis TaxID=2640012 RepID=UPI001BAF6F69|nr:MULTISPECIES: hypothetical protein [unclassified Synechocystis]QUS60185.1 hypothetical protein HTZ78_05530 [Synechocystis sp. PCC 7338]UAJ72370.1 hypothetical protein IQE94_15030 [Synechocystis sp. PCC 7339]
MPDPHLIYFQPRKSANGGKFLGTLLLFSLLSIGLVQGCTYTDQSLSPPGQNSGTIANQPSSPSPLASPPAMLPQAIADKIIADLAQRTGEPASAFQVQSSENKTWPDSCLGLVQEGQMCAQVMTPGWQVTIQSGQKNWVYRTDQNGRTILLES